MKLTHCDLRFPLEAGVLLAVLGCSEVLGDVQVDPNASSAARALAPNASDSPALGPDAGLLDRAARAADAAPPSAALACSPGAFRCEGAALQYCSEGGAWALWQTCDSAALCASEPAGRCLPSACEPDERRCEGARLQRCNADATGWEPIAECATAAHCDPVGETCREAPCELEQRRCNRGELQRCRADQLDWDVLRTCDTQALCRRTLTACEEAPESCAGDALTCVSPTCEPEQKECDGARLRQCNRGRTGWALLERCANAAVCQASLESDRASCLLPTCAVDELRCSASGGLERCTRQRLGFELVQACGSQALCDAELGVCESAVCASGGHQCTADGEVLDCNADLTGFVSREPPSFCDSPALCDAESGRCRRPPADEDD